MGGFCRLFAPCACDHLQLHLAVTTKAAYGKGFDTGRPQPSISMGFEVFCRFPWAPGWFSPPPGPTLGSVFLWRCRQRPPCRQAAGGGLATEQPDESDDESWGACWPGGQDLGPWSCGFVRSERAPSNSTKGPVWASLGVDPAGGGCLFRGLGLVWPPPAATPDLAAGAFFCWLEHLGVVCVNKNIVEKGRAGPGRALVYHADFQAQGSPGRGPARPFPEIYGCAAI